MTGNDELLTAVPAVDTPDIDIDDVEGHGLKEVVVGLSAAAVLGGGVASAASAIPPIGDDLKTPGAAVSVVQGAQDDVNSVTGPTVRMADNKAKMTVKDATSLVQTTSRTAMDAVRTVDGIAADQISGLADTVRPVVEDPAGFAGDTLRPTVTKADGEVDGTVVTARHAVSDVTSVAKATITVVDTTLADAIDGASSIVLGLQSSDADADLGVQAREMVMQAKVGNEVIGSATWQDGAWTIGLDSRHLGDPITFSVGGGKGVAPLTVHFTR